MSPKRIREPVKSPRNPFDVAKIIDKALKNLCTMDKKRAIKWALEYNYIDFQKE